MRDYILLFVNGVEHRVTGKDAFLTLSDFLRDRLQLCGTKIVCSEGDCGSCSVLVGKLNNDQFEYHTIDSCIRFVFQLDGCHIVSVEGIGGPAPESLSPVQQAMIDCHGSQCGFCTPGFVVAMTGVLEDNDTPDEAQWRHELTGNLCRCTGYSPIIAAGLKTSNASCPKIGEKFDQAKMVRIVQSVADDLIMVEAPEDRVVACPTTLDESLDFLATRPDAKIVSGGTDVGVQFNKGHCKADKWLDLNRVAELRTIQTSDTEIIAGAAATWSNVESECASQFPQFQKIISIFGSPQIRNVGTIGGNIINASPIADSLPFLFVTDATLELTSVAGKRTVNINEFYSGYKQFDLQPGELLTSIRIPIPQKNRKLELYKVSRRLDMDISTFTGAIWMDIDGDQITSAGVAMGAVGPVVIRLKETEQFLTGKPFDEATMVAAGEIAIGEITPITDVRGTAEFRYQLTKNIFLKFYHRQIAGAVA